MTPYFLRLLPCTAGVGGTENEEYMKKIRPYLWRGGALVLAAALVVLLVLSGMGLSTQEPEPLPQPPAQTIRTEGQGGASQQEKPNAPEQPEDPEDEDTPEEPETPEQPDEEEIRYSVAQVKEACKKLSAGYRVILSLYLFEGYDMEEIASILKIQPPSVRSQYLRAKRKLLDIIAANKENG